MLKFSNPCEPVIVRVIYSSCFLELRCLNGFKLKTQRPVRKFSISVVEKLIDGTSVDQFFEFHLVHHFLVVCIEHDLDVWMRQHLLKHFRIPMCWHRLISIGKI